MNQPVTLTATILGTPLNRFSDRCCQYRDIVAGLRFDDLDIRGDEDADGDPESSSAGGRDCGFAVGQQFGAHGTNLGDRSSRCEHRHLHRYSGHGEHESDGDRDGHLER